MSNRTKRFLFELAVAIVIGTFLDIFHVPNKLAIITILATGVPLLLMSPILFPND